MAGWWQADEAFFELIRDKEVLTAIVAEVAGETVAAANAREKGKTLKRDRPRPSRRRGRARQGRGWVPRWMAFPPSAYTARGGVATVAAHAKAEAARASALEAEASGDDEPDPAAPAARSGFATRRGR